MLTGTSLDGIKYAAIEVILKTATKASDVECGLYMGLVKKKDKDNIEHTFLAIVESETSIRLYNTKLYNVMTVDVMDSDARFMTVFTKEDKDQEAALTFLSEISSRLAEEKKMYANDPNKELINVDRYVDYPEAVLKTNNITGSVASSTTYGTGSTGTTSKTNTTTTSTTTTTTTTTTKPEPEVMNLKRKGKLPMKEKLEAMKDKVLRLATGDFELKALPIPPGDREEEEAEDKKTGTQTNTTV